MYSPRSRFGRALYMVLATKKLLNGLIRGWSALRAHAVEESAQGVRPYAVNGKSLAGVGDFAKQQLSATVAVRIDHIDKFQARNLVKMLCVCDRGKELPQFAVDVEPANYHHVSLNLCLRWAAAG